jgi:hypothetical protein
MWQQQPLKYLFIDAGVWKFEWIPPENLILMHNGESRAFFPPLPLQTRPDLSDTDGPAERLVLS